MFQMYTHFLTMLRVGYLRSGRLEYISRRIRINQLYSRDNNFPSRSLSASIHRFHIRYFLNPQTHQNCPETAPICTTFRRLCCDSLRTTFQHSHTTLELDLDVLYPRNIFSVRLDAPVSIEYPKF